MFIVNHFGLEGGTLVRNVPVSGHCSPGTFQTFDYNLGPVVQSIVSLTTSLKRHFVNCMPTTLSNPLLFFFVEKM